MAKIPYTKDVYKRQREHAALVPLYLGVRAVIAKSFARIHKANLVNAGILPLEFTNPDDYDRINLNDALVLENLFAGLEGQDIQLTDQTSGAKFTLKCDISSRQAEIIKAGGLLNFTREKAKN